MENVEPLGWIILAVWGVWLIYIFRMIYCDIKEMIRLWRENKELDKSIKELDAGKN